MSLNLKIECSGMRTGWQGRPGKFNFELEGCQIEPLTREQQAELCGQMDFDLLVEYVNSFAEAGNAA